LPSASILEAKKKVVAELADKLTESCAGIIVEYRGVSVADDTALRAELRANNVEYKVVKNSILKRAAEKAGLTGLEEVFKGTTAIAISNDDPVAPARILKKFADIHKNFNIKSGYMDGVVAELSTIESLAALPPKDILLATVCNALNAPISAFARVIQAIVDKSGEEVPVKEETSAKEAPAKEAPAEEAPAKEAPVEEAPAEEAPVKEALAEEAPVEEAPAEEAPVKEALAEEAPVEEAPAEEAPAEEASAEKAPAEEAPAEEAPVEEAPVEK